MGTLADSLFNVLMGWVRALVNSIWALFDTEHTTVLEFLGKNWLAIAAIIIAVGLVVDWLVWLIRWRPYHRAAQRVRRVLHLDEEEQQEPVKTRAHAAVRREAEPLMQQRREPVPEFRRMPETHNMPDAHAYPGMRYGTRPTNDVNETQRYAAVHSEGPGAAEVERRRAEIDAWRMQMADEQQAASRQAAYEAEQKRKAQAAYEAEQKRKAQQAAYEAEQKRKAQAAYEAEQKRKAQAAYEAEQKRKAQQAAYEAEQKRKAQAAYEAERKREAQAPYEEEQKNKYQASRGTEQRRRTQAARAAGMNDKAQQAYSAGQQSTYSAQQAEYARKMAEYEKKKAQYEREMAEYQRKKAAYDAEMRRRQEPAYSEYVTGETVDTLPAPPKWPKIQEEEKAAKTKSKLKERVSQMIEPDNDEISPIASLPPRIDPKDAFHTAKMPAIKFPRRKR